MKRASTTAVLLVLGLAFTVCAMSNPARAEDREAVARRLYVEAKKIFRSARCLGLFDDKKEKIEVNIKCWEGMKSATLLQNTLLNDYPETEAAFQLAKEGYVTEQQIDELIALRRQALAILLAPPPPLPPPLSLSVIESIRHQIEDKWNVPIGRLDADSLSVELRIVLQRHGEVHDVQIIDRERMRRPGEENFRAMAESAARAVWQASPLRNLPPEQYDQWQEITLIFRPPV